MDLPSLPKGRKSVDIELNIGVDEVYKILFTEKDFYKKWLQVSFEDPIINFLNIFFKDMGKGLVSMKNFAFSSWRLSDGHQKRKVTLQIAYDNIATIDATIKQVGILKICIFRYFFLNELYIKNKIQFNGKVFGQTLQIQQIKSIALMRIQFSQSFFVE